MKSVRYSRYTGEDFGLSAEDLMKALSDFFLESGFNNPYDPQEASDQNVQDLHDAILEALLEAAPLNKSLVACVEASRLALESTSPSRGIRLQG